MSGASESADFILRRNRPGGVTDAELGAIQRRSRSAVAELLGVPAADIALAPNTSYGVNVAVALVAQGPPGTIVLSEGEFPANVLPWKVLEAKGFRVDVVPSAPSGLPDEDAIVERLGTPDVRALAVSSVQFSTGFRMDLLRLGEACGRAGALFCVDAIQSLGVDPCAPAELGIDVLSAGGQKWLCSPWGSGFVYLREELRAGLTPPMVSWLGVRVRGDLGDMLQYRLDWHESARKFELASLGLQDYLGLARAVEILLEMGVDAVRRHVAVLHEPVLDWVTAARSVRLVTPTDGGRRAGIVSFVHPRTQDVAHALSEAGVVFAVREGAIRLSPHFYNTPKEMDAVVA
ncbi:MAG: aminotransferase class V-fold PLP-dependent enzyme, partial [Gemmatimonadota bacterium]|nr:aminotransferase class V-fold PLP-dependent enzyme [Gemmatimonadota bacterium]